MKKKMKEKRKRRRERKERGRGGKERKGKIISDKIGEVTVKRLVSALLRQTVWLGVPAGVKVRGRSKWQRRGAMAVSSFTKVGEKSGLKAF